MSTPFTKIVGIETFQVVHYVFEIWNAAGLRAKFNYGHNKVAHATIFVVSFWVDIIALVPAWSYYYPVMP